MRTASPRSGAGGPSLPQSGDGMVGVPASLLSRPAFSAGVVCSIGGAYTCGTVAAPQNLCIGDSGSLSFPFHSEFSMSLVMCVCDGDVFALDQGWGHQGSGVPTCCAGQLQTDASADTCASGVWQGGVCKQTSVGEDGYSGYHVPAWVGRSTALWSLSTGF